MIMSLKLELYYLWDWIVRTVTKIWSSIEGFFLRFMSPTTFLVLIYALVVIIIMLIVLAIVNRN